MVDDEKAVKNSFAWLASQFAMAESGMRRA
jgi:hypothetical protein